jgi:hypothetical protein
MYSSGAKTRTETSHEGQTIIRIMDQANRVMWVVNPQEKQYVEMKGPQPQGRASDAVPPAGRPPMPDEPGHFCQEQQEGLTCQKLGTESVNGRQADKWEFIMAQRGRRMRSLVWLDQTLRIPVREESQFGTRELRELVEGPQPDHLFELPEGYTKVEVPQGRGQSPGGAPY